MSWHTSSALVSLLLASSAIASPAFGRAASAAAVASASTKFVPQPSSTGGPQLAEPIPFAGIGVGVSATTRSFTSTTLTRSAASQAASSNSNADSNIASGNSGSSVVSSNSGSGVVSGNSGLSKNGNPGKPIDGNGNTIGGGNTNVGSTAVPAGSGRLQQSAATVPQGIFSASDGSTILDTTVNINGQDLRFRVSGPSSAFLSKSQVNGATGNGKLGLSVLLHGDGGQTFWDFPNQDVSNGLMGVVLLAPDANLNWGGGSGLNRVKGEPHAKLVNDFILNELPKWISFDNSKVYFTGVDGGSMLLSGFFIPAYLQNFKGNGVLLNCGAMVPHVGFKSQADVFRTTRIHFQSTQNELDYIQKVIPQAFQVYQKTGKDAGVSGADISAMQTVNNAPNGGHCAFDSKAYKSGIQLMMDNFANVMFGDGSGNVPGIGNVWQGTSSSGTALKWGKSAVVV